MGSIGAPIPFQPSPLLRRRRFVNRLMKSLATGAALLAIAVLGVVVYSVAQRGGSALSFDFLTKDPNQFTAGGGIAPYIVGTAELVLIATAIALPLGVLIAIYLSEFARRRTAAPIVLVLDLLNGLPSIVIGLFVFSLLVAHKHQSGLAGAFGLAIVMLPLVARTTQELLRIVPESLREGATALGVSRWRTVVGIVLPAAIGGILTGTVLAVARVAGETAPLLFATSVYSNTVVVNPDHAVPNIPVQIFNYSQQADPSYHTIAWGMALVLMGMILVISVAARALHARSRRNIAR
jgi:phosphate transport system permease protein